MTALWAKGRATVADVTSALAPPLPAYNTVLSTMRTLEQKGYVAHEECKRAFVYYPLVERADAAKSAVSQVLARFFQNSPNALAMTLLDDVPLSQADRRRIRELLEPQRRGKK